MIQLLDILHFEHRIWSKSGGTYLEVSTPLWELVIASVDSMQAVKGENAINSPYGV